MAPDYHPQAPVTMAHGGIGECLFVVHGRKHTAHAFAQARMLTMIEEHTREGMTIEPAPWPRVDDVPLAECGSPDYTCSGSRPGFTAKVVCGQSGPAGRLQEPLFDGWLMARRGDGQRHDVAEAAFLAVAAGDLTLSAAVSATPALPWC